MRKATKQWILGLLVLAVIVQVATPIEVPLLGGLIDMVIPASSAGGGSDDTVPVDTSDPTYLGAAKLQFSLAGYITGTSLTAGNARGDVWLADSNGHFDLTKRYGATITINSSPEQGLEMIAQHSQLIIRVGSDTDPTGGTDHYDMWYAIPDVDVGQPIYEMGIGGVQLVGSNKYKLSGNYIAQLPQLIGRSGEYGSTTYWELGSLTVKERTTAANLDTKVLYGGTTLSSVTDGSSFVDTLAEQSADGTLTSNTGQEVQIHFLGGANNIGFGTPMLVLTSDGILEEYAAFIIVSTNCTTIDETAIYQASEGWKKVNDNTLYAEKAWYATIPEAMPNKGDNFDFSLYFPFEPTAASTGYSVNVWIIDFNKEAQVAAGSVSTTIPTANGGIAEFGIDAKIYATAFSTSSGAGSGMVHFADITSAS
jgi:hypothetical protein